MVASDRDRGWRKTATGLAAGAVAITAVSLLVAALKDVTGVLALDACTSSPSCRSRSGGASWPARSSRSCRT
jgi:hypothetical protein